jgi:hypothetical protein
MHDAFRWRHPERLREGAQKVESAMASRLRQVSVLAPADKIPTADEVIAGHQQIIARAHLHHLRIIGATLTPFEHTFHGTSLFGYYSEEKEKVRQAANTWIRESGAYDGWPISTRWSAIPPIPSTSRRSSIPAIISTRTTPAMSQWPNRSTSVHCSETRGRGAKACAAAWAQCRWFFC